MEECMALRWAAQASATAVRRRARVVFLVVDNGRLWSIVKRSRPTQEHSTKLYMNCSQQLDSKTETQRQDRLRKIATLARLPRAEPCTTASPLLPLYLRNLFSSKESALVEFSDLPISRSLQQLVSCSSLQLTKPPRRSFPSTGPKQRRSSRTPSSSSPSALVPEARAFSLSLGLLLLGLPKRDVAAQPPLSSGHENGSYAIAMKECCVHPPGMGCRRGGLIYNKRDPGDAAYHSTRGLMPDRRRRPRHPLDLRPCGLPLSLGVRMDRSCVSPRQLAPHSQWRGRTGVGLARGDRAAPFRGRGRGVFGGRGRGERAGGRDGGGERVGC